MRATTTVRNVLAIGLLAFLFIQTFIQALNTLLISYLNIAISYINTLIPQHLGKFLLNQFISGVML